MKKYLKLLRVKHYIKNVLVFLPLFFARGIFDVGLLEKNIMGFINFCFAASIVYVINDMRDIEKDRNHPTKCKRPLASGEISMKCAYGILSMLIIVTFLLNICINKGNVIAWLCVLIYVASNFLYSFGLKNVVLMDVFILVLGYVLRIYYGASIVNVEVSAWLYLTVIAFAFYLGLGKRRNELVREKGNGTRKVLLKYNKEFLDKNMYMCLALTIVFYSLWCENMSKGNNSSLILLSVPMMIIICMRYSLLVEGDSDGDPIEVVLSDKVILGLIVAFFAFMVVITYTF